MLRRTIAACAVLASGALAAGCATTDAAPTAPMAASSAEQASVSQTAHDCAAGVYDRMFLIMGDGMYVAAERNQITGMLRDSAVAGQGADADAERRIRNMLSDGYGAAFLEYYRVCMETLT